jgi:hypothetical protein
VPAHIRDASEFQDTPPSPVLPAVDAGAQHPPIDIVDATNLETINVDESSIYPPHLGTRWTRIDKAYVDPQILVDADEQFHEDGYSIVVHRVLRRGELKQWVQKTLEFRLKRPEGAQDRGGVSGHTWLDKGKQRERDERDLHQAKLDRVLAGDMGEEELRHFKDNEEGGKKRW